MIQSIFILSDTGEVLIEKHWRETSTRTLVDLFLGEVNKCHSPNDVLPVITTAKYYLINVFRNSLFLLAVVAAEVSPLLVVEVLHRAMDTFEDYFGTISEVTIKDNFTTVYLLLEEMLDNGYPLVTEPNTLKSMIAPPSVTSKIAAVVTGTSSASVSEVLPDGAVSNVHWRNKGLQYSQNEIYFDILETIDCTVEPTGRISRYEINGQISSSCKLSGMPDMTMTFANPEVVEDYSFHRCVKIAKFDLERLLSFVPPDGKFELMRYSVAPNINQPKALPIYCTPQITFSPEGTSGRVEIMVGLKHFQAAGPTTRSKVSGKSCVPEDIMVILPLPRSVTSSDLRSNIGTVVCNETSKECEWRIGRVPKDKSPKLTGTFSLPVDVPIDPITSVQLKFKIPTTTISGLQVSSLTISNTTYKFFKGVRSSVQAGSVEIRL